MIQYGVMVRYCTTRFDSMRYGMLRYETRIRCDARRDDGTRRRNMNISPTPPQEERREGRKKVCGARGRDALRASLSFWAGEGSRAVSDERARSAAVMCMYTMYTLYVDGCVLGAEMSLVLVGRCCFGLFLYAWFRLFFFKFCTLGFWLWFGFDFGFDFGFSIA